MKRKKKIHEQDTEKMLDIIAAMWPEDDRGILKHQMAEALAQHYAERWRDREHCLNCRASMLEYTYTLNRTAARALIKYAAIVMAQRDRGMTFTEANKIYLQGAATPGGTLSSTDNDQKTILRYHGLIAKVKQDGKQKDSLWAITRWGWAFLRGEVTHSRVTVWRGEITERSPDTTTIREALATDAELWNGKYYDFATHEGDLI